MKNAILSFLLLLVLTSFGCAGDSSSAEAGKTDTAMADHDHAAAPSENAGKKNLSPRTSAMAMVGDVHVHIDYSAPGVRGRTIWGGLVAYDQVWVTGAHKATSIDFNKDVKINGQLVPAGTYGFFTIPGREKWVVILNKNHEQHLADDYDQALDILRLTVTPEQLSEPVESLTYEVKSTGGKKGMISVMWDQLKISFAMEAV